MRTSVSVWARKRPNPSRFFFSSYTIYTYTLDILMAIGIKASHFNRPSKRWTQKYWFTFPPSSLFFGFIYRSHLLTRTHILFIFISFRSSSMCVRGRARAFLSFIYFVVFIRGESVFIHLQCNGISIYLYIYIYVYRIPVDVSHKCRLVGFPFFSLLLLSFKCFFFFIVATDTKLQSGNVVIRWDWYTSSSIYAFVRVWR